MTTYKETLFLPLNPTLLFKVEGSGETTDEGLVWAWGRRLSNIREQEGTASMGFWCEVSEP